MRHIPLVALPLFAVLVSLVGGAGPDSSSQDERTLQAAKVAMDGPGLLDVLRKRTLPETESGKIKQLIKLLGDDSFEKREQATEDLVRLGNQAEGLLQQALKDPDVEVSRRAEECLRRIKSGAGASVETAAIRMLGRQKPAGAAEALLGYLPFAPNYLIGEEVKDVLASVAMKDGQPDKAMLAALTDKSPLRRSAAAVALVRAGGADEQKTVRLLLKDGDPTVRVQVALALAEARDKEAIPVLIELLAEASRGIGWQAEEVLYRLAGEQAPKASLGINEESRKKCRDAWADWWTKNSGAADMSRLQPSWKMLGRSMVVLLDENTVQEMDAQGKVLWQIKDAQFPLDAQSLPNDRVLIAEHASNKVTERDFAGKVHFEKEVGEGPLVAQRLPNGNTFIATAAQLLEVDKEGKEVLSYKRPLETIRKATKMRNGDICMVTSSQRFVRLSPDMKQQLQSFEADIRTNGGKIDVLPNGHVLVPLKDSNKVVEFDIEGKPVWEMTIDEPIAAVRLPNGHTLVTTLSQNRAVE
ncbi:MAG: HEAT repeat domain-containing protein, partial [Planctomycetia bacterium]|nr:HEAT repeat domain-containing protein [Planctomycetia bacterium]